MSSQPVAPQIGSLVEHASRQQLPVPSRPQIRDEHWALDVHGEPAARPPVPVPDDELEPVWLPTWVTTVVQLAPAARHASPSPTQRDATRLAPKRVIYWHP